MRVVSRLFSMHVVSCYAAYSWHHIYGNIFVKSFQIIHCDRSVSHECDKPRSIQLATDDILLVSLYNVDCYCP
jgi:hypothetical protein